MVPKTHQVSQQELEALINDPPPHLAPMAGMIRNLHAQHQAAGTELAVAEYRLSEQERDVASRRANVQTLKDQREVMTAAWRQLVIAHRAAEASGKPSTQSPPA